MAYTGTAVQRMNNKIADYVRMITDNVKIFGKIQTFYKAVYHKRPDGQSQQRIQTGLNVKDKETCDRDQDIGCKQGMTNIKAGVFFQDHGNNVRSATGRTNIKKNGRSKCGKCDRKA